MYVNKLFLITLLFLLGIFFGMTCGLLDGAVREVSTEQSANYSLSGSTTMAGGLVVTPSTENVPLKGSTTVSGRSAVLITK